MTPSAEPNRAVRLFSVWAPAASRVRLRTSPGVRLHELRPGEDGWWSVEVPDARPGTDYGFLLDDDETPLPDPRSRWQPYGVHGPSRLYDSSAYVWRDSTWTGRPLPGAVIYELHIGTFTPGATFASAIPQLDHLAALGVTHVEVLPVNAFNGVWNWGYDGVDWYAVHEPYGGPDGLKRFVDACHARGLAVILDVVYNHLGPSGNYLPRFGPYLKSGRSTWGDLVNLELPQVRAFIIENALMWLSEFHIDGLRLDAVHALIDTTGNHILAELATRVDALSAHVRRPLTLIAESDLNDPVMVTPRAASGYGLDAQWDDDIHHSLHALITGERTAYYVDFGSLAGLAKVLNGAFFHDGTYSTFRGRDHGRPVARDVTPGYRFIGFLQDHDQVGNRAAGERISAMTSTPVLKIGVVLLFTSPFTPMLWMGEEWAASTPWPFFTSHPEAALAAATGAGRIEEFRNYGWDTSRMPDPQDPETYRSAILRWDEVSSPQHAEMFAFYRRVIALRRAEPELSDPRLDLVRTDFDEDERWLIVYRGSLRVIVNLANSPRVFAIRATDVLLATGSAVPLSEGFRLAGESVAVVRAAT